MGATFLFVVFVTVWFLFHRWVKAYGQSAIVSVGGGFLVGLLVMGVMEAQTRPEPEKPAVPELTPVQRAAAARRAMTDSLFSPWDGSHPALERIIKRAMNDPDSYKHVETVYSDRDDHLIVRTTYRGRNAFGGVVMESVEAKVDLNGNVIELIDRRRGRGE